MNLIILPVIALLGGAFLQLVLGRLLSPRLKGWLAVACGFIALVGVVLLVPQVLQNHFIETSLLDWDQGIAFVYHIDGLSLVFMLMATLIGTAILLYSVGYMAHEEGTTRFYALMLTFIAGLVNLVSAANLLVAYVSWEIIGLCSYLLVGFWYRQTAAANGAKKVLVITHLAGYGFLAGLLLLYKASGSFLWTDAQLQAAFSSGVFFLMLIAAMAKSVMFPLHTWIPEAMNAPTPVSALLHSACYVKAGIYLLARFYSITAWQPEWNTVVLVIGAVTMVVGAIFALAQTDLKRLLAYSTISQLGHIVLAFGLGTPLGLAAGVFYTISHGLFKGTLFMCAGSVQHATGTRDMRELGGLAQKMPITARIWLIAAGAIVGVPLGNGFIAKWMLYDAALESGKVILVLIAWLVSVLTMFYMLKATVAVFYGAPSAALASKKVHEAGPEMRIGMGFLAVLCLLFGVAPQLLILPVVNPAVNALNAVNPVSLSWLGLQSTSSGINIIGGALIALAAVLAGVMIFAASRAGKQTNRSRVFTGGDPLPSTDDTVGAMDISTIVETNLAPVYKAVDPDPLYFGIWRGIRGLAAGLSGSSSRWLENNPALTGIALAILLAAFAWFTI